MMKKTKPETAMRTRTIVDSPGGIAPGLSADFVSKRLMESTIREQHDDKLWFSE
jgi:hypothetical protein